MQDSLDAVEELLKKHEDFEKLLLAQEERFTQLNRETQVSEIHCTHLIVYMNLKVIL